MAACRTVLFTLLIFVLNLQGKRSSFVNSDFIGFTLLGNEIDEVEHGETFICSSLFQAKGGKFCSHSQLEAKFLQYPYPYVW